MLKTSKAKSILKIKGANMLILKNKKNQIYTDDPPTVSSLVNGCIGVQQSNKVFISSEEAMYLMDIRNAECPVSFSKLMQRPAKYFGYKAWRDRGLHILDFKNPKVKEEIKKTKKKNLLRDYSLVKSKLPKTKTQGKFYKRDLMTVVDENIPEEIYYEYWFGQLGTYKTEHRGRYYYLDVYETLYLIEKNKLKTKTEKESIIKTAKKRHKFFELMYNVYKDWRKKGFVLKTGFKFGSHFRLYFPGATPKQTGKEWMHSKNVIHVFPYKHKLLISEWSRAIRVAHSVRKTFILGIPKHEKDKMKNVNLDYLVYHRKNKSVKKPGEDDPSYVMWCLSEEEYIGGAELAYALHEAKKLKLGLVLAIVDRETSVTFYRVIKIKLPQSKYEYYEIEWVQP